MDLMKKVTDKECNIIKNEEHLNRVTTSMFSKVSAEERDLARLKELENAINENGIIYYFSNSFKFIRDIFTNPFVLLP